MNEPLLKALANWMREDGKMTQAQIDHYALRFSRMNPGDAYPCPKCYCQELGAAKEQPLSFQHLVGASKEWLRCAHCKTVFELTLGG